MGFPVYPTLDENSLTAKLKRFPTGLIVCKCISPWIKQDYTQIKEIKSPYEQSYYYDNRNRKISAPNNFPLIASLFVDVGLCSRCMSRRLLYFKTYFSFQLFRPGVLFFIHISTTANEMKAGDCKQWQQIRRARAVSVVLYSLSTQIHSNHFFRGAEDKVIVKY